MMTMAILAIGVMMLAFMYGEMYHAVKRPGVCELDHPPNVTETVLRHELTYLHRHHRRIPKYLTDLDFMSLRQCNLNQSTTKETTI